VSEYRDELRACNERIAQVEAELARRGGPRKPPASAAWFVALGAAIFAVGSAAVVGFGMLMIESAEQKHKAGYPAANVPVDRLPQRPYLGGAQWYASSQTPILHDVNGDGVQDIVGLAWDRRDNERALHAVAFDGTTHQLIWHSDGVPAQWGANQVHLVRTKQQLVLTDTRGTAHVFDITTGKELHAIKLEHDLRFVCALEKGTVALFRSQTSEPEVYDELSAETGALEARTLKGREKAPACILRGARSSLDAPVTPSGAGLPKSFESSAGYAVSGGQLSIGSLVPADAKNDAVPQPYAAMMAQKSATERGGLRWHAPLPAEGETVSSRAPHQWVTDADAIYFIYVTPGVHQPFRVVARSLATGALLWNQKLAGTDEGQRPQDFASEDGRVFVAMGGTLHVLDAKTGTPKPPIVSF